VESPLPAAAPRLIARAGVAGASRWWRRRPARRRRVRTERDRSAGLPVPRRTSVLAWLVPAERVGSRVGS
jgi:hypothetical protein